MNVALEIMIVVNKVDQMVQAYEETKQRICDFLNIEIGNVILSKLN